MFTPRRRLALEPLEDRRLLATGSFPVPLSGANPLGSLIYNSSIRGEIDPSGETDRYTIDLDDGQTITVVVDPEATLQPMIGLLDPSGAPLDAVVAAASGEDAVLPVVPTPGAGTYTVFVGGGDGSTGTYTVRLILNAAVEMEAHDGPTNDDPASAQDLDATFILLGGGPAQRGAVLGTLPAGPLVTAASEDFESGALGGAWSTFSSEAEGRVQLSGEFGTAAGSFALLMDRTSDGPENLNEAIFSVDLAGKSSATLSFFHAEFDDLVHPLARDFSGHYPGDGVAVSNDGVRWHTVFDVPDQVDGEWVAYTIDLGAEAEQAGMALGPNFQIKFQQYDQSALPGGGRGYDEVTITAAAASEDWYGFRLDDGQPATLALCRLTQGNLRLELYGRGQRQAAGVAADNLDQVINHFVDGTSDGGPETYFARVSGTGGSYSLMVTRGGDFDSEPNNLRGADAQDITPTGTVLGALGLGIAPPVSFAVFGDYGSGGRYERNVAEMVKGWQPDFIITTGDNNYGMLDVGNLAWMSNIGAYYGDYIRGRSDDRYPEQTSPVQRFFPVVGNHDGGFFGASGGDISGYLDYFHEDPLGGRLPEGVHNVDNSYYDFQWGPIHFFAVDSDHARVLADSMTAQREWLQNRLADSTADWKFVYFHHTAYSSSLHGSDPLMQWPFRQWGADAVFAAHDHVYERVLADGLPYLTTGLGGGVIYPFRDPIPGSMARYNEAHGALRVTVGGRPFGGRLEQSPSDGKATFEFLSIDDGAAGAGGGRLIDTFTIDKPLAHADAADHYRLEVNPGDVLRTRTFTPGDGPLEPTNELDPMIELYDPAETLVAGDDNGAPDGRNAQLTHTAAMTGTYTLRVTAAGETQGEYLLEVGGYTGAPPALEVSAAYLSNEHRLPADPPQITVKFSDSVRAATLNREDLTVDGTPAAKVTLVEGDTAEFELPAALGDGRYELAMAAGAVFDLTGGPIEPFAGTFSIDTTPPRVIASSVLEGDTATAGTLTYSAQFSKALHNVLLERTDVELVGQLSGTHRPTRFDYRYDPVSTDSTLTLEFTNVPEDSFTLTLFSGDGRFEDRAGRDLDGEPHPAATVPSGDGTAGGDFVVRFTTDTSVEPYPTPLEPKTPRGSLIYDPSISRSIGPAGDTDSFTIDLKDGQTITAVVNAEATLWPMVELFDPGGTRIGSAVAAGPGEDAVLQTIATTGAGTYRVTLGGFSETTGLYRVELVLNAAVEAEEHGGPSNRDPASAQDLEASFIAIGDGSSQRGAVLGRLPSALGEVVVREDFRFPVLGGQWTTYSSLPEGRIRLTGDYGTADGPLALMMDREPEGPSNLNEAILSLDLSGLEEPTLSFFHVAWTEWTHQFSGDFTGHRDADGVAISDDGVNWHPVWNAAYQTDGVWIPHSIDLAAEALAAGMTLGPDFRIKFQQFGRESLNSERWGIYGRGYDEIRITTAAPIEDDWYRFTLRDGQSASVALAAMRTVAVPTPGAVTLELYDGSQNLLAVGVPGSNVDELIENFVAPAGDGRSGRALTNSVGQIASGQALTYFVRVAGSSGADYGLVITRDADFDAEPNAKPAQDAQDISPSGVVLGQVGLVRDEVASERQKLTVSDAESTDSFGNAVALSGDAAIVGAKDDDDAGSNSGSAYVFRSHGGRWIEEEKLTASDAAAEDQFGASVALSGDTAIVGSPYDDDGGEDSGSVYVFRSDGIRWFGQEKLTAADAAAGDLFGYAVAISGDTVIVGARWHDAAETDAGAAYVFRFDGSQWIEVQKLIPSDARAGDSFGSAVSLAGDTAVVGAPRDNDGGTYSGAAYVFRFDGNRWLEQQQLLASDPRAFDLFGTSVSLSGDTAIVGAPNDDVPQPNSGAAYVFSFDGREWLQQQKLLPSGGGEDDEFGVAVSINGQSAIVGAWSENHPSASPRRADAGAAYLFRFDGSRWIQQQRLITLRPDQQDYLGSSVALSGKTAIVGAPGDDEGADDSGAVYIFPISSPRDEFALNVQAGDSLSVSTATPFSTMPGGEDQLQFVNHLDPAIELYDPQQTLVAADDNSRPDGRNAMLMHTATMTGEYTVRVLPADPGGSFGDQSQGEYVLSVNGPSGPLPPFEVWAGNPADGTMVLSRLTQMTVQFSDSVLVSSLEAADLSIDASPARGVSLVDGRTVVFDLPADLGDGPHGVAIAGGAIHDLQGTPIEPFSASFTLDVQRSRVVGRHVFYNNSAFDENDSAANAKDDGALPPPSPYFSPEMPNLDVGKAALLPGQTATFANYTSFDKGINGIMVDLAGLPGRLTADDFRFRVGNSNDPAAWDAAPAPIGVSVRAGAGDGGSDRVTIVWEDNAIEKQWLQVTLLANANTGLAEADVFYFGNAIGESGNSAAEAKVNVFDMLAARDNQRSFINPAPLEFFVDYNRDARVDAFDLLIARDHPTNFLDALKLITVPAGRRGRENTPEIEKVPAADAVFEQAGKRESASREAPLLRPDWVYEFEQTTVGSRSSERDHPVEKDLDKLPATWSQAGPGG